MNLIFDLLSFPLQSLHPPKVLLNKGVRVQILGLKPNTPLLSAVVQVACILESLNVKTAMKIDLQYDEVIAALRLTSICNRVSKILNTQTVFD